MTKVTKVAISLPQDVLETIERERKASGESRSEFFRRAVVELLRQEREKIAVEKYIQSYQQIPETIEEVEAALSIAGAVLAEEPWNEKMREMVGRVTLPCQAAASCSYFSG